MAGPDGVALAAALAIVGAERALADVWPGYWAEDSPFALYPFRGDSTLVIWPRHDRASPGQVLRDVPRLPLLDGRAFVRPGLAGPPNLFTVDYSVGDRSFAAVSVIMADAFLRDNEEPPVAWMADSVGAVVMFALHESFHAYQTRAFCTQQRSPDIFCFAANIEPVLPDTALLRSEAIQARLSEERRWLRTALLTDEPSVVGDALRRYYAAREARYAQLPQAFRHYEAVHERAEGTALLVGYEGATVVFKYDQPSLDSLLAGFLLRPFGGVKEYLDNAWLVHHGWHLYVVGATKSRLLSRWTPGWHSRVEQGAFLDEALERFVNRTAPH